MRDKASTQCYSRGFFHKSSKWTITWLAVLVSLGSGCSRRAERLPAQDFDIASVVVVAITEHDTDGNGVLDQTELQSLPSLLAVQADIDSDRDGAISEKELTARIEFWRASRVAIMPAHCEVIGPNGRPLVGATVTFEPEPFLADVVHEAKGVTGSSGVAAMSVAEEHRLAPRVRGVYCGFYRVRVSLVQNGKETIEGQYNVQTTLGTEVYPNQVPHHVFHLTGG